MRAPEVLLAPGDEASGMASMLSGLLTENLRDFRTRAWVAGRLRGEVVLSASDRGFSVTISFRPGVVEVTDGVADAAPVISGPWLTMAKLCSGQVSPLRAWRDDELRIERWRGVAKAAAAGFVLSVPASFYGESSAQVVTIGSVGLVATAAIVIVIAARRRRRACSGMRTLQTRGEP